MYIELNGKIIDLQNKVHKLKNNEIATYNTVGTDDIIHILLSSNYSENDRFLLYTLVNSIIINERAENVNRLYFHILVNANKSLVYDEMDTYFRKSMVNDGVQFEIKSMVDHVCTYSHETYFCLPLIFDQVSVGIYLESDMIVLDSISQLYDYYYDNSNNKSYKILSTHNNVSVNHDKDTKEINKYFKSNINFSNIEYVFDPSIMIYDLNIWRKYNFIQHALELFQITEEYSMVMIINTLYIINRIEIGNLDSKWHPLLVSDIINCNPRYMPDIIKDQTTDINMFYNSHKILHLNSHKCYPFYPSYNLYNIWIEFMPQNLNKTCKYYQYMVNESYNLYNNEWIQFKSTKSDKLLKYRLGDMIYKQCAKDGGCGYEYHIKYFPNSIASKYMKYRNKMNNSYGDNYKLLQFMNQYNISHYVTPSNSTLVIHLRLGDNYENPGKVQKRKQWARAYHSNPISFLQHILPEINMYNLSSVAILTGFNEKGDHTKSIKYIIKIRDWFKYNNFDVILRINENPDNDFIYMSNSKYFIKSEGKFSFAAASLARSKGGKVWDPNSYFSGTNNKNVTTIDYTFVN